MKIGPIGACKEVLLNTKPVIVVTGTKREALALARVNVEVIVGGSDPERLLRALRLAAPRAGGIVSFGMGGAIDRGLRLGYWVIGRRVIGAQSAQADEAWVEALHSRLPHARVGAVYADGRMLARHAEKTEQSSGSAALVADMESHIVAQVAQEAGVPFAVLRCISDVAQVELPPAVEVMMGADGAVDWRAMLRSVLGQPGQIFHLARTLRDFAKAYEELQAGVRLFGPRLAFDAR
jgi:adenosylhomocysteine nucleosidase